VAAVLEALDADAVLLQEVEDLPLLGRLALRAGYPEARLLDGNDPRGIDVGLLSRLPVVRSRFYLESVALQSRVRGGEGRPAAGAGAGRSPPSEGYRGIDRQES